MKYYHHHIVMDDGEKFDMVLDSKLEIANISNERWLPYNDGWKTVYLNIAHISRIYIKVVQPIEKEE